MNDKKQIGCNLFSLYFPAYDYCLLGCGVEIDITTLLNRYFSEERNREMYSRLDDYSYIGERLTCQITIKLGKFGNFDISEGSSVNKSSRSWLAPHVAEDLWSEHSFKVQKSDSKERDDDVDEDFEGQSDEGCPTGDSSTVDEVAKSTVDKQFKLNVRNISMDNLLVSETEPNTSQDNVSVPSSMKYERKIESGEDEEETCTRRCPVCGKLVQTDGSLTRHLHKAHGIFKWSCDQCDEKFITKRDLRKHVNRNHSDNSSNQCSVCGKVFGADIWLIRHLHKEHGVSKYPCNLCDEKFTRKFDLIKHVNRNHDERPYKCTRCDKRFESEENRKLHEDNHDRKKFECSECGNKLATAQGLRTHMKLHTMTEKPFKCDHCGSSFLTEDMCKQHVRKSHGTPLECEICGVFIKGSIASLRRHMLNVHGEKYQYKCDVCEQGFEAQYELQAHKRSHAISWQCNICGQIFTIKRSYQQHIERHSGVAKYECDECNRMFLTPEARCKHMVTHRASRDFHCELCGKSFKTFGVLKRHQEIHENKRKYKCKLCGKGFNSSGSIIKHRIVHEREGIKDVAMYCNSKLSQ